MGKKGKGERNPADAYRKAIKKKAIKKNKEETKKRREEELKQSDPGKIESNIERLRTAHKQGKADSHAQQRISKLERLKEEAVKSKRVRGHHAWFT